MAQVVQLGEWEMRFRRAGESMNAREENREGGSGVTQNNGAVYSSAMPKTQIYPSG